MKALLMGGQACVFYGAAEFSRDVDLLILVDPPNLDRLRAALRELEAEPVAVPSLDEALLRGGHAVHFRCTRDDVQGLRIDVMAHLRGCSSFDDLYERRTTIQLDHDIVDMLSLPDLVLSKKTQRNKDWPMIQRLVEQNFFGTTAPAEANVEFWLQELRTPELLVEVCSRWPAQAASHSTARPVLAAAMARDLDRVRVLLENEEKRERERDRVYWEPLRRELEALRMKKRRH